MSEKYSALSVLTITCKSEVTIDDGGIRVKVEAPTVSPMSIVVKGKDQPMPSEVGQQIIAGLLNYLIAKCTFENMPIPKDMEVADKGESTTIKTGLN